MLLIAVTGLSAGLVISCNAKRKGREDVEEIQIAPVGTELTQVTDSDYLRPTYVLDLNKNNSFSIEYVMAPTDLKEYYMYISLSNDKVAITSGNYFETSQTGVVEFGVRPNIELTGSDTVTITFSVMNKKSGGDAIVKSAIDVVLTKPSSLQVPQNIRYDGSKIVWDKVEKDIEGNYIASESVKYAVELIYEIGDQNKIHTCVTDAGVTYYDGVDFTAGVVNSVTVTALGDGTHTSNSGISEEYKFYILKTPKLSFTNNRFSVTEVDDKAAANVMVRENILQNGSVNKINSFNPTIITLNAMSEGLKEYTIHVLSTMVADENTFEIRDNNNDLNMYHDEENNIYYFDSVRSEKVTVKYLTAPNIQLTNEDTMTFANECDGITSFGLSKIYWENTIDNALMTQAKYSVTIDGLDNPYLVSPNTPYLVLNPNELGGATGRKNTYSITINTIDTRAGRDKSVEGDQIVDGLLLVNTNSNQKLMVDQYLPASVDNIVADAVDSNGVLHYTVPKTSDGKRYYEKMDFVFVSGADKYQVALDVSQINQGEINLLDVIQEDGDYDLYIGLKGNSKSLNCPLAIDNSFVYVKENVYQTIGGVKNLKIDKDGKVTFEPVSELTNNYQITIDLGNNETYTFTQSEKTFNIIDKLNNDYDGRYDSLEADKTYKITVLTKSNTNGCFGAKEDISFKKFAAPTAYANGNYIAYDRATGKISWNGPTEEFYLVASDVISDGSELVGSNSYSIDGTELAAGKHTFKINVAGRAEDGEIAILRSDLVEGYVEKLATPVVTKVVDGKLYWEDEDLEYIICVYSGDTLATTMPHDRDISADTVVDLNTITGGNKVSIKAYKDGYIDSDECDKFAFEKISQPEFKVSEGEEYILVANDDKATTLVLNGLEYELNTLEETIVADVKYKQIPIADLTENGSTGLKAAGLYTFKGYFVNNAEIVSSPAYLKSSVTTYSIRRLADTTLVVNGASVTLNQTNDFSKISIEIVNNSNVVYENSAITSNSFTIQESDFSSNEAGEYTATITTTGDVNASIPTLSPINSNEVKFVKLSPTSLGITTENGVHKIKINNANEDYGYILYRRNADGVTYNVVESSKYTIANNVITLKETVHNVYYSVALKQTGCLNSDISSNEINIKYSDFNGSKLVFSEENTVSFAKSSDASSYIIDIKNDQDVVGTYVITGNDVNISTADYTENGTISATTPSVCGVSADEGNYYIDLTYLYDNKDIIEKDKSYKLVITFVGDTDNSTYAVNNTGSHDLDFHYIDMVGTSRIDDVFIIDITKLVSKGYTDIDVVVTTSGSFKEIGVEDYKRIAYYTIDLEDNELWNDAFGQAESYKKELYYDSELVDDYWPDVLQFHKKTIGGNPCLIIDGLLDDSDIYSHNYGQLKTSIEYHANAEGELGLVTTTEKHEDFIKMETFGKDGSSYYLPDGVYSTSNRGVWQINDPETLYMDDGELKAENLFEDFTYIVYLEDVNGNKIEEISDEDFRECKFFDGLPAGLYTMYIQKSKTGALISEVFELEFIKPNALTNVTSALTYDNTYALTNYSFTWISTNQTYENIITYLVTLTDGETTKELSIPGALSSSITTIDGVTYYVTYDATQSTYLLNISADSNFRISKVSVSILGESVDNCERYSDSGNPTTNVLRNTSSVSTDITHINKPARDSIKVTEEGLLEITKDANATEMSYMVYPCYSNGIVKGECIINQTLYETTSFNYENSEELDSGYYLVVIRYIGNETDVVTSAESSKVIEKLDQVSAGVVEGKLTITDFDDKYIYRYMEEGGSAYETVNSDGVIPSDAWADGNKGVTLYRLLKEANDNGEYALRSTLNNMSFYKSKVVTKGLTDGKELWLDKDDSGNDVINLKFVSDNVDGNVDRVGQYIIYLNGKKYASFSPTEPALTIQGVAVCADSIERSLEDNQYVYTVTIPNNILQSLLEDEVNVEYRRVEKGVIYLDFTIQIAGDDKYIENLEDSKVFTIGRIEAIKYGTNAGDVKMFKLQDDMFIYAYSNTLQDIRLTFLSGDTPKYIYTVPADSLSATGYEDELAYVAQIDFTKVKVAEVTIGADNTITPTGDYVILPAGQYKMELCYVSNSDNILDSLSLKFTDINKAQSVDYNSIKANGTNIIWQGLGNPDDENAYYYTFVGNISDKGGEDYVNSIINTTAYESGKYEFSITSHKPSWLKSDATKTYSFQKLHKTNEITANFVKLDTEYYIEAKFKTNANNTLIDGDKQYDLARAYNIEINQVTSKEDGGKQNNVMSYTIPSHLDYTSPQSINSTGGANPIKVTRAYNGAELNNFTYTIYIPIQITSAMMEVDSNFAFLSDSLVSINGMNNSESITISIIDVLGSDVVFGDGNDVYEDDNLTHLRHKTSVADSCSVTLNKTINSSIFDLTKGVLTISGLVPEKKENVRLFRYIENKQITIGDDTIDKEIFEEITTLGDKSINELFANFKSFGGVNLVGAGSSMMELDAGKYFITVQYIDQDDMSNIYSNMTHTMFTVSQTPKLYTNNGELSWDSIGDNATYLLAKSGHDDLEIAGSNFTNGDPEVEVYNTDCDESGEYTYSIRGYIEGEVASAISPTFTAIKLDNPTLTFSNVNGSLKLSWNLITNSTGYAIAEHTESGVDDYTTVEPTINYLIINDRRKEEICDVFYFIYALGDTSKSEDGETYKDSGYLSSFYNPTTIDSPNEISFTYITNTIDADSIRLENGAFTWDHAEIAGADDLTKYYKVYLYYMDKDTETYITYTTTTLNNYIRISDIPDDNIQKGNNNYIHVFIELVTNSNEYVTIMSKLDFANPNDPALCNLANKEVFKHNQDSVYLNPAIDNGMIRYQIEKDGYFKSFADSMHESLNNRYASDLYLNDLTNNVLKSFVTPTIIVDEMATKCVLGTGVFDTYYYQVVNGTESIYIKNTDTANLENIKIMEQDAVYVCIPLPESYLAGKYTISLAYGGATTRVGGEPTGEVFITSSVPSDKFVGYKLPEVYSKEVNDNIHNYNGIMQFGVSQSKEDTTYVSKYLFTFTKTSDSTIQQCEITIATSPDKYDSSIHQGYIGENNTAYVDLYALFVDPSNFVDGAGFAGIKLETDTDYNLHIRALGRSVVNRDTGADSELQYYNSSNSSVFTSFNIIGALNVYIKDEQLAWDGVVNAQEYKVYLERIYDTYNGEIREIINEENEVITVEEMYTVSANAESETIHYFTQFRNNDKLPAGIYLVYVVAVGNGNNIFSSRKLASIAVEKLEAVKVSVEDGRYMWTNPRVHLNSNEILVRDENGNVLGINIKDSDSRYSYYDYHISVLKDGGELLYNTDYVGQDLYKYGRSNEIYMYTYFDLALYTQVAMKGEYELDTNKINVYTNTSDEISADRFKGEKIFLLPSDDAIFVEDDAEVSLADSKYYQITSVSGIEGLKLDTNGKLTFVDKEGSTSKYTLYAYNNSDNFAIGGNYEDYLKYYFMSANLDQRENIDLYKLAKYNGDSQYFDPYKTDATGKKTANRYLFAVQALESGFLRSAQTTPFALQFILQPYLNLKQEGISCTWDTDCGANNIASQLTITGAISVEGDGLVDGDKDVNLPTIFNYSGGEDRSFNFIEKQNMFANQNESSGILETVSYTQDVDKGSYVINYKTGGTYDISVKFMGHNGELREIENTTFVVSSLPSEIEGLHALVNPGRPINPVQSPDPLIVNGLPTETTRHNNYIYIPYQDIYDKDGSDADNKNYDLDLHLIKVIKSIDPDTEEEKVEEVYDGIKYTYNIRVNGETPYVKITDFNNKTGESVYDETSEANSRYVSYVSKVVGVDGYYISLDWVLADLAAENTGKYILKVHARSVANDANYLDTDKGFNVSIYEKLVDDNPVTTDVNESNYLKITLPDTPQASYDKGIISWESSDTLRTEIAVAYKVSDGTTEYVPNYANIYTSYKYYNGKWHLYDHETKEYKELVDGHEVIRTLLDISEGDYYNADGSCKFFENGTTYRVDVVDTAVGIEEYKLKYVTDQILRIVLRAIGPISGPVSNSFVSAPFVITEQNDTDDTNLEFNIFTSGTGRMEDPFEISDIKQLFNISHYFDEFLYYEYTGSGVTVNDSITPLGAEDKQPFNGVFDFGNKQLTIYLGLHEDNDDNNHIAGLFYGIAKSSVVMNLKLELVNKEDNSLTGVYDNSRIGGVAVYNHGLIANVTLSGDINVTLGSTGDPGVSNRTLVGGVTSENYGTISYVDSSLNITCYGYAEVGGVAATNEGNINVVHVSGSITGFNVGGIVYRMNNGGISYTTFTGNIYNDANRGTENGYATISSFIGFWSGTAIKIEHCLINPDKVEFSIVESITQSIKFGGLIAEFVSGNGSDKCIVSNSHIYIESYTNDATSNGAAIIGHYGLGRFTFTASTYQSTTGLSLSGGNDNGGLIQSDTIPENDFYNSASSDKTTYKYQDASMISDYNREEDTKDDKYTYSAVEFNVIKENNTYKIKYTTPAPPAE